MKIKLKSIAILIFVICFLSFNAAWAEMKWQPITGNEHNMVVYGHVISKNIDFNVGSYDLYSFGPGGEQDCRAKNPIGKDGFFSMLVAGNSGGEIIKFKVADQAGNIFDLQDTVIFQPDETIKNIDIH